MNRENTSLLLTWTGNLVAADLDDAEGLIITTKVSKASVVQQKGFQNYQLERKCSTSLTPPEPATSGITQGLILRPCLTP